LKGVRALLAGGCAAVSKRTFAGGGPVRLPVSETCIGDVNVVPEPSALFRLGADVASLSGVVGSRVGRDAVKYCFSVRSLGFAASRAAGCRECASCRWPGSGKGLEVGGGHSVFFRRLEQVSGSPFCLRSLNRPRAWHCCLCRLMLRRLNYRHDEGVEFSFDCSRVGGVE